MSERAAEQGERPTLRRRIWTGLVSEFTPPVRPRPAPSDKEFADGHLAIGMIIDRIEDGPGGDVQGPDMLVVSNDVSGHGVLHRQVPCPLSVPGSGRDLIGQPVRFRHTTFDPHFIDDISVVRWPPQVNRALAPVRFEGPGAFRARVWNILAGCCFVVMWAGMVLTPILLCGIVLGGDMFTDLPAGFRPGIALAGSVGAVPLGLIAYIFCNKRQGVRRRHWSRGTGEGARP